MEYHQFSGGGKGGGGGGGRLESWGATLGVGKKAAAAGLTLRRGDSTAATGPAKLLSVAVIGLSGGEKESHPISPSLTTRRMGGFAFRPRQQYTRLQTLPDALGWT